MLRAPAIWCQNYMQGKHYNLIFRRILSPLCESKCTVRQNIGGVRMSKSDNRHDAEKLMDAKRLLSGLVTDAVAPEAVCANLETALALAGTIKDIGHEAAPVFRA
jgi:hypothetical protein